MLINAPSWLIHIKVTFSCFGGVHYASVSEETWNQFTISAFLPLELRQTQSSQIKRNLHIYLYKRIYVYKNLAII